MTQISPSYRFLRLLNKRRYTTRTISLPVSEVIEKLLFRGFEARS